MIDTNFTAAANKKELLSIFQQLNDANKADVLWYAGCQLKHQIEKDNKTEAEKAQETAQNERKERLRDKRKYRYLGNGQSIPVMISRASESAPVDDHETIKFKKRNIR